MRLALAGLALSLAALALHTAVAYLHAPLRPGPQAMGFLSVFGTTWPIWAYVFALYRRHLQRARAAAAAAGA